MKTIVRKNIFWNTWGCNSWVGVGVMLFFFLFVCFLYVVIFNTSSVIIAALKTGA